MSTHMDEDGWWWATCLDCEVEMGPFPDQDDAITELVEHECRVDLA